MLVEVPYVSLSFQDSIQLPLLCSSMPLPLYHLEKCLQGAMDRLSRIHHLHCLFQEEHEISFLPFGSWKSLILNAFGINDTQSYWSCGYIFSKNCTASSAYVLLNFSPRYMILCLMSLISLANCTSTSLHCKTRRYATVASCAPSPLACSPFWNIFARTKSIIRS